MEQVEAAVRENDPFPLSPKTGQDRFQLADGLDLRSGGR